MITVDESVKLINRYKHLLQDHDLKDILAKTISVAITDKTGIYTVVNSYSIHYVSLNIFRPFTTHIDAAKKELQCILKSYDLTLKQAQQYVKARYIIEYMACQKSPGNYQCPDTKAHHALTLIRYCLNGYFAKAQSEVNEWLEKEGIDSQAIQFRFEYEGVKVQRFKNGRLDISGLKKNQENRLLKLLKIRDEVKRMNVRVNQTFPYQG